EHLLCAADVVGCAVCPPLCRTRVSRRAAIIVLDGLGIGPAYDSDAYGDAGSEQLGNVARAVGGLALPNLEAPGLGCWPPIRGLAATKTPGAAYGVCEPASAG